MKISDNASTSCNVGGGGSIRVQFKAGNWWVPADPSTRKWAGRSERDGGDIEKVGEYGRGGGGRVERMLNSGESLQNGGEDGGWMELNVVVVDPVTVEPNSMQGNEKNGRLKETGLRGGRDRVEPKMKKILDVKTWREVKAEKVGDRGPDVGGECTVDEEMGDSFFDMGGAASAFGRERYGKLSDFVVSGDALMKQFPGKRSDVGRDMLIPKMLRPGKVGETRLEYMTIGGG